MRERNSAQAIGKYERGEMIPSSTVSIALSKALGVSMSYLLSPSDVSLEGVEFRKLASTKARERAMVEGAVLNYVDRYLQVEQLLDISSAQWEEPEGRLSRSMPSKTPRMPQSPFARPGSSAAIPFPI